MRRQALEQEVERIGPPIDPDLDRAEKLLDEFAGFWEIEHDPAERRRLLGQLFDRIWQDDGIIVAVRPRAPFARYFWPGAGAPHHLRDGGPQQLNAVARSPGWDRSSSACA